MTTRTALVTGAAGGGIGTQTALSLARSGYAVAVHGRDSVSAEETAARLRDEGWRAEPVWGDLADPEVPARIVAETENRLGPVNALVHNAAAGAPFVPLERLTREAWRADIAVILDAAYLLSAASLPAMRAHGSGRIVFVSSSAAWRGSLGRAASYAAAKAGLTGLARQMALDCGADGVTVNVVAPSQIDTPRIRKGGRRTQESLAARGRSIPLGRVGTPADVAETIAFLCSPAAAYLTGVVLPIDGGSSLSGRETGTEATIVRAMGKETVPC